MSYRVILAVDAAAAFLSTTFVPTDADARAGARAGGARAGGAAVARGGAYRGAAVRGGGYRGGPRRY